MEQDTIRIEIENINLLGKWTYLSTTYKSFMATFSLPTRV